MVASLLCDDPAWAQVPATVTIPAGAGSAQFTVTTPYLGIPFKPAHATIHASYGGVTVSAVLTIRSPMTAGILQTLTLMPDRVTGGFTSQAALTAADRSRSAARNAGNPRH